MEAAVHGLSEPDVLAVLALAGPPVLLGRLGDARVDAGLSSLHVTEDLDGVGCAANVGVDPVVAWRDAVGKAEGYVKKKKNFFSLPGVQLTALPVRVTQFQVSAGASGVLLGAVGAAQVLDLAVEGLERGVDLDVVLPQGAGGLVSPHVPERIRRLLGLTQTGEGRHVDTRARRTRRTRGSGVSWRSLKGAQHRDMCLQSGASGLHRMCGVEVR